MLSRLNASSKSSFGLLMASASWSVEVNGVSFVHDQVFKIDHEQYVMTSFRGVELELKSAVGCV